MGVLQGRQVLAVWKSGGGGGGMWGIDDACKISALRGFWSDERIFRVR